MSKPKISIVFRALNEARWFEQALEACGRQEGVEELGTEIILVDSGSTDGTLDIAARYGVTIHHIQKSDFTFGRSLNLGCEAARGDVLVFISAHCIPEHTGWLRALVGPILDGSCDYVYGRQLGHPRLTRLSEAQVFAHFFGDESRTPQDGFFCNNANAAIRRSVWQRHRFDEKVTGLEDMVLAKAITQNGGKIGYVAEAPVVHIHEESLQQTHRRYYREALTMREIMPEVHFNLLDMAKCLGAGIAHDLVTASRLKRLWREIPGILGYRFMQYWGTYRGHNEHRELSRAQKESYYYPRARYKAKPRKLGLPSHSKLAKTGHDTR